MNATDWTPLQQRELDRIRERIKKTVEGIIEVGNELLAVKDALPHGQFLPWLRAEFGWSERSAQNFMSVAEQFKSAKIADLPIQPSAAYLLAAPSVPDEAREKAVEKAIKEGEGNVHRTKKISLKGNTIPHRVIGKYGASRVVMVPAGPGTGVKAGPGVREVLQACGVTNILTKVHGSTNPINLVKATIDGLLQLRTKEEVVRLRGVAV